MIPIKINDPAGVTFAKGFKAAGIVAGLKKSGNKDLALIYTETPAAVAGTFTQNKVAAAPVHVSKLTVKNGTAHAVISNAGCANACTGDEGLKNAHIMGEVTAKTLGCKPEEVIVGSTGVIGVQLPMDTITAGIPKVAAELSPTGSADASAAILTTDTKSKTATATFTVGGKEVHIGGIAKGSGMIRPNMATMLGFLAFDATVAQPVLDQLVKQAADKSFNCITIDGDTSTNDSFMLVATGAGSLVIDSIDSPHYAELAAAVTELSTFLAQAIVRDGEGATKFITVRVEGGKTGDECRQVAYAIAHSPLVKTAFYASDPNLGRILAAVGYAGIADLDQTGIDLYLDDVHVAVKGGRNPAYREEDGQRVMKQSEITVRVLLGRGDAVDTVWTCDFSHEYVTINADYRS